MLQSTQYMVSTWANGQYITFNASGAPNDGFLPNPLKTAFRPSIVVLDR